MNPIRTVRSSLFRFGGLFRKDCLDRELSAEIESNLALHIDENVRAGMSPSEARRQALLKFGGIESTKEGYRDRRGIPFLETTWQDVRFALRMLRKSPGFTTIAVLTLALGIGANAAIFSVVDATLLSPLHFGNPSSLVMVWEKGLDDGSLIPASPPNFLDWQDQNRSFSGMAAFVDQTMNITGAGQPEQVNVEQVSPNFFSVLDVAPMLGRGFSEGEDQLGESNIAVLSYGLWKSEFVGDPKIIGKAIRLNGRSIVIVGVTGPDFDFYIREHSSVGQPQLWTPLQVPAEWHQRSKVGSFLRVIARLNPGISLSQAQAQMSVVAANLAARYSYYDTGIGAAIIPLRDQLSGRLRTPLFILLGAVGFLLLIACANLSSLLLSRASGRRHEIAIRLALGASRSRVIRQLLTESLLLGVLGGALGTLMAVWATKTLTHVGSGSLHYLNAVAVDWRVLAFAAGITLFAASLAGVSPSFMAARGEAASMLSDGRRASDSRQSLAARNAFVVLEISLALVLLAGSSLLIESFFRLTEVDPGFRVAHLLTFQVTLPDLKYGQETARAAFFSRLLGDVRALPGAISATADVAPPFDGLGLSTVVGIVGKPPRPPGENLGTRVRAIEPDYFRTLGIPLLHGRTFYESEFAQQSNVVIVNKAFAEEYLRGKNPLGQKIIIYMSASSVPDEIVGIVGDVHESSLAEPPDPLAYWPYPRLPYRAMNVVVRTETPPLSLVPAIRQALHRIDKDEPMAKISTMDQLVASSVARSRFMMLLLSAFAGLALVLACIGIYGVVAYSVVQRTHEIGIRMALGAAPRQVMRVILSHGLRLAFIGAAVGVAASFALTRLMSSLLFGISAADPATFGGVTALLLSISLAACYIPARRAMRVDPIAALRHE